MNAISIREPYASAIAYGLKRVETRGKPWPVGPIAIHASIGLTGDELDFAATIADELAARGCVLTRGRSAAVKDAFPNSRGHVIALATLDRCVWTGNGGFPVSLEDDNYPLEDLLGNYSANRYGLVLSNVLRLERPIKATGQLGVWDWTPPLDIGPVVEVDRELLAIAEAMA